MAIHNIQDFTGRKGTFDDETYKLRMEGGCLKKIGCGLLVLLLVAVAIVLL